MSTLLSLRTARISRRPPGDYVYLSDVVRINYPVRDARVYLNRHLGNPVTYRLVEARRGEPTGQIRAVEILPHAGGETVMVIAHRELPDGSPATWFTPEELVSVRIAITVGGSEGDNDIPPLRSRDRIILHVPVRSYLRYLPGIFQGSAATTRQDVPQVTDRQRRQYGYKSEETADPGVDGTDQFRRFLLMFQHLMTTVTDRIDNIPSLTDPTLADPSFLPWIASWVSFELDGSLPLHQQRELVRRSIRLHRTRGTVAGVTEMIRVLTSAPVEVEEREKPQPCVLGAMTLAGGQTVEERFLRNEPTAHYLIREERAKTTFFVLTLESRARFRERFGERATAVLRRISQIVTQEKPANITFTIRFKETVD
jgi:phage tail-like protein